MDSDSADDPDIHQLPPRHVEGLRKATGSALHFSKDLIWWAAFPSKQCPQRVSRVKLFLSSIYTGHFIHKERMRVDIEWQRKEKATKMNREEVT